MKSHSNKTSRKFGKRAYDRFSIPGATVSWVYRGNGPFPEETTPLSDLSRNGFSFLTNTPPEVNSEIDVLIALPKNPGQLELTGRTVYSVFRGPGLTYEYRVGAQFKPFAPDPGENSPESQKAIEELEDLYGKHLETEDIED
jgi:hypothetical protein